jgi:hypothetical protein
VLGDQVMAEEREAFYQTIALPNVAGWVNKLALNELVEQTRARKGRRSHERRHAR